MKEPIRLAITGAGGYLGRLLVNRCRSDPDIEFILGVINAGESPGVDEVALIDVRDARLAKVLADHRINALAHLAWVFDPTHDPELEDDVDINGSRNVLYACASANVRGIVYASSTTSYGPHPDNPLRPPWMSENYPRRGHSSYRYSRNKAVVDEMFESFMRQHPDITVVVLRAPIVFGPGTQNVVTYVMSLPLMFRIKGADPPMQFIHEADITELLYLGIKRSRSAIVNVSGDGIILYSEVAKLASKPCIALPAWLLYPLVGLLWRLRLLRFPPSLLDFIRYPWVADNERMKTEFGYTPRYDSRQALEAYLEARRVKPQSMRKA